MSKTFIPSLVKVKKVNVVKSDSRHKKESKVIKEDKSIDLPKVQADLPKEQIDPDLKSKYNKKYYQKHKEEHLKRYKVKVVCSECSRTVNKQNLEAHKKTALCLRNRPKRPSFINYEHIQRGLDLIDLISKSFKPMPEGS